MAEHPRRALLEWLAVLGVGIILALLLAFVLAALILMGFRALASVLAYLDDEDEDELEAAEEVTADA